jgi:serine/threonine protein kinase
MSNKNKVEKLGSGIFGEVRKELDNEIEKEIAIKTINIQKLKNFEEKKGKELIGKIKKKIERIYKLGLGNVENNFTKYYGEATNEGNLISFKMELCN